VWGGCSPVLSRLPVVIRAAPMISRCAFPGRNCAEPWVAFSSGRFHDQEGASYFQSIKTMASAFAALSAAGGAARMPRTLGDDSGVAQQSVGGGEALPGL